MIFFKYQLYQVPWNSMEFHRPFWGKIKISMEFHGTREYRKKFHGIPWNFGSGQNSMEFHGIPWNLRFCCLSAMEFHGTTGVVQMLFKKFHGTLEKVPWNFLIKISFNEHWKEVLIDILIRNEYCRKYIRYNANINNKTSVGERDLLKDIGCL